MIDITITATQRAEILERTLASFKTNLFKDADARIIINIDPVGPDLNFKNTLNVAQKYFPLQYIRTPETPSFPKAFIWTWRQANSEFVFHLEDDWELMYPVDLGKMIKIMNAHPDLAVLRLPFKPTGTDSMKNWKYFFPYNGIFFECPQNLKRTVGFCGHPSLISGEFVRNIVQYLDENKNPEKQFHHGHPELMKGIDRWRFGVFAEPNKPAAIQDIGRRWMIENNYKKAGNKSFFIKWEKTDARA